MKKDILIMSDWLDLLNFAESGNTDAQYEVGFYYENGLNIGKTKLVKQNLKKAFKWYQLASQNVHTQAIVRIADFLSEGVYCAKNIGLAIEFYEKGVSLGSSIAANNLGTIYRDKGEYEKAFEYYSLAQKLDNSSNSFILALCYFYGIGTLKDKMKALKILRKISEDTSEFRNCEYEIDEANYLLGKIYLEGEIVEKSIPKARDYLKLADKDNDHRSAQELLLLVGRAE